MCFVETKKTGMITIDDIKQLIAKDETRTLELKKTTGELYKGMETACAFLNSDGGWLMFGITPSLKIDGQNVTDNTRQEIANALRKIEPAIDVEVEYIELPEKTDFYVIAIYFDSNNFKNGPYSFDGRPFYKVESTTALMPRQMYEERLRLSNPRRFSWENTPNTEITVEDINTELLYQTLHDGIGSRRIHASAMTLQDPEKIMLKLGVAKKDGTILNAANVLFGKETHHAAYTMQGTTGTIRRNRQTGIPRPNRLRRQSVRAIRRSHGFLFEASESSRTHGQQV